MSKSIFYFLFFMFIVLSNAIGQNVNENADSIHKFSMDTSRFVVIPVNLNSSSSDYCPVMINNEMVFTSDRQNVFGVFRKR